MPIYDNILDYIFEADIMVEHGWNHPLHVRKKAQKEYLELRKENKYLIELCKGLFGILEGYLNEYGGWADDDIIGIEKCYKAIMQKHYIKTK